MFSNPQKDRRSQHPTENSGKTCGFQNLDQVFDPKNTRARSVTFQGLDSLDSDESEITEQEMHCLGENHGRKDGGISDLMVIYDGFFVK